ncbi:hypothetical protein [Rhodoferax sp. WC2427]|uniref:hypothetical protein n=1 Tax=Rhodoferax sp. WC2427 TaxID=3234144 RepID=UPI00346620AD
MDKIATARATAGILNDLVDAAFDHHQNTGSWVGLSAVLEERLTTRALERFEPKIRNMFERAGVPLPDGPLTSETMAQVISERTGLEVEHLTPSGITSAIDKKLSVDLSLDLGIDLGSVLSAGLKSAIEAGIKHEIETGRGAALISKYLMRRVRKNAAFTQAGYQQKIDQKKVMNRINQARYRRTHKQVWT